MESNPYAAPAAVVDDVRVGDVRDLGGPKTSRGKRLGAAWRDGLINVVWMLPMVWSVVLLIFGAERRRLHDLIADTIVIDV